MNEKFILNVFDKFEKSSAVLLHIKEGEAELTLKKEAAYQNTQAAIPYTLHNVPMQPIAGTDASGYAAGSGFTGAESNPANTNSVDTAAAVTPGTDANLVTVKSPIVGSFYRSPSPDAPAYVDKGSKVSKGQPLCILEAMKMMNTLECEYDGIIEDILAANGDLVEFDQPLFTIRI